MKKGDRPMNKRIMILALIIGFAILNSTLMADARVNQQESNETEEDVVVRLKYDMQELWIEHAWWTRDLIVSRTDELADSKAVLDRLLENQVDIGNIIKPYYGEETGNKLTELLKEHILIGDQLIVATVKGDKTNAEKLNTEWQQSADKITAFLASVNPNWSKKELSNMFHTHLKLTADEVNHRMKKDWAADIKTAELNELHLVHMGEYLTDGIVKQYPEKFK